MTRLSLAAPAASWASPRIKQWQVNQFFYGFGGGSWGWGEKLRWSDEQWRAYAEDERLRTWIATYQGAPSGYFELHRDDEIGVKVNLLRPGSCTHWARPERRAFYGRFESRVGDATHPRLGLYLLARSPDRNQSPAISSSTR